MCEEVPKVFIELITKSAQNPCYNVKITFVVRAYQSDSEKK